jgi:alpha-beta hydrolase superfamily lysophospholipase
VVVVGGALEHRGTSAGLARQLARRGFRAVRYDRRGRGDSGDSRPYAVQREVEDLRAVLAAVGSGGPAFAHGVSSGGALLLTAMAEGLPVSRVSVFEPPYRVEGAPTLPQEHVAALSWLVTAGDRAGLLEYYASRVRGRPADVPAPARVAPAAEELLALAPTLVYDALVMGGDEHAPPRDTLGAVGVPVLAVASSGTEPAWLVRAAAHVAGAVPRGRVVRLPGGCCDVPPEILASTLATFYRGGCGPEWS